MTDQLRFTPLANVTTRKRRARHDFIRRQKLFAFRLSGWFVMGQTQTQPDSPQNALPSN